MRGVRRNTAWRIGAVGLLALAAHLPASSAVAQSRHQVTGTVTGPEGGPASGAMVVALALPDSALVAWETTGGDGAFSVGPLEPGDYLLQVTLIGHQTIRNHFTVVNGDVAAGSIGLEVLAVEIDPLVVSVEHVPFLNRRDTLSFNANAFEVRPNATVEDLLKRLPGIEVGADGSITAQGEDVQKVLVDGKEFFGEDPTIATRNLRADAVERVDVYDKESDRAEFTGIPDGQEERTINLGLREEARRGYFGDVSGGFGTEAGDAQAVDFPGAPATAEDRVPYDGKLGINRFSPTTQLALIGNASNVGQPDFRGGPDGGLAASEGLFENLALGLNASHDFGSDTWLRSSYFFGRNETLRTRSLEEERLLGSDVSSFIDGMSQSDSEDLNHKLDLNSQVGFGEGHDVRIRGNLLLGSSSRTSTSLQNQTLGGEPFNSAVTDFLSDRDAFDATGRLTWRKRLNDSGRSLIAEARMNYGDSDRLVDLVSTVDGSSDPRAGEDIEQEQLSTGETLNHSVRLSLTEPLGAEDALEFFGERSAIDENEAKRVFDLDEGDPVFNPVLSSEFDRTYTYLRGGMRFSRNTADTRFVLGLELQNSDLEGRVLDPEANVDPISSGFTHLLPLAELRLQLSEGRNFRLRYNTSTREPSMTELQPFVDNDDPLDVYVGNPDLDPEYRHRFRGEYRLFDQFSFVNLFTYASLTLTEGNISRSRSVDETGRQTITPENSGSAWTTRAGLNYGRPIRPIGAQVQFDYRLTWSREKAFVNEIENRTRILQNSLSLSLENRDQSNFELRAGGGLTFNDVDYSLNGELNQSYMNPRLFADASLYRGPWEMSTSLNHQGYDADVFGPDVDVTLWQASIKRLVLGERAEIELAAYDLLNQNRGISVTNTANFNRTERVQSLGRHLMLRINYHLGSMGMSRGSRASKGGRDGPRH